MIGSRFLWKLYAGYVFLILLTTGLVGGLVATKIESETLADTDRQLRAEATLLRDIAASSIKAQEEAWLQKRIEPLGAEIETRLTVIRLDGAVLADSAEDPQFLSNHARRPELLTAQELGVGTATRYSQTLKKRMRYLALPIRDGEKTLGFARTSLPLTSLYERLDQLRFAVVLAATIATAVALVLGFLHARRVTRPLLQMTNVVQAVAAGDREQRIEIDSNDELGVLARAFNHMDQELKQSLDSLKADHNTLTAILSSMVEGVVAVDRDERIVHMNEVAGRLLALDPAAVLHRPIWEVTRIREISEALTETLKQENLVHRVVQLTAGGPAGTQDRVLDLHTSPLQTGDGVLAGAVLVLNDITQLRRLETMRRDFFGNVSHELKTPVTAIRGMVETMLDDPELDANRRQRFLSKVSNQTDRLSNLVTDLLSVSRLESAGIGALAPLDVREVIEQSINFLQPNSEAKSVKVESQLPSYPVLIEGEEEALRQAVNNLLDNAIKYTPRTGSVQVQVAVEEETVIITVADSGIGIGQSHLERIFERFYRVDTARSREIGGTGLGLAIVKHTVLAMGGKVSVDSTLGSGTTFTISFPLLHPSAVDPKLL